MFWFYREVLLNIGSVLMVLRFQIVTPLNSFLVLGASDLIIRSNKVIGHPYSWAQALG